MVEENYVETKLWEHRFWGFDILHEAASVPGTQKDSEVIVSAPCRANWMRVTGYGHYHWEGNHHRSEEQFSVKYVDCET